MNQDDPGVNLVEEGARQNDTTLEPLAPSDMTVICHMVWSCTVPCLVGILCSHNLLCNVAVDQRVPCKLCEYLQSQDFVSYTTETWNWAVGTKKVYLYIMGFHLPATKVSRS